jgi:hypothetical protein
MNSKAFYERADSLHPCVQENMNSACVALIASILTLLLPLKIEWLESSLTY